MWITTRFAPSPTGALHIGHAASAIAAHDFARQGSGRFLLRIEDIDGTRSRPEHVAEILADLDWLGLAWDGPVTFQSQRLHLYEAALDRLRGMGLLYPCFCTRAEIAREVAASLSAPHGPEGVRYPGTCRRLSEAERARRIAAGDAHCWRLDMNAAVARARAIPPIVTPDLVRGPPGNITQASPRGQEPFHQGSDAQWMPDQVRHDGDRDAPLTFHDAFAGTVIVDPLSHGDVVLARKDAPASYHVAVTVDDAAQGVTHIVRGKDLFEATHVHRLLQALLDLPTPEYRHHPLLTDAEGNRLAKRHGAPTLASLRAAGMDGRALADDLRAGRLPPGFGATQD